MNDKVNKAAQDAVKNAETIMKDAQDTLKTAFEKASKSLEDVNKFNKDNLDAVMKSSEITAKSTEQLGKEIAEISKKNFDTTVAATQEFASVKTVNELFEKQTNFVKASFDTYTAQFKAIADLATKSAKEASAPLQARAEAAGDLAKTLQA